MRFQKILVVGFWSMLGFDNISGGYGEVGDLFELNHPAWKPYLLHFCTFCAPGDHILRFFFLQFCFFWKLINLLINFIIKNNPCKFEAFLWDLKNGYLAKPPIEKGITDKTCKINLFCYIRTLINHWLQIPTPIIMWQFFATRWLSAKVVIAVTFIY